MRTKFEIADVLKLVDTTKGFSYHQQKAFKNILECRTDALDGHANNCTNSECGNVEISYNSCRSRACPKCGWKKNQDWIIKMSENILPAKHFHNVFTIPHEFNNFFLYNKAVFANLLFKASQKAVLDLIKTKWKVKGACISVLHTWGSALNLHPHVHMIVPAGGFDSKGQWVGFRKQYLANKEALSLHFRNIFMKGLKKLIAAGDLKIPSCHEYLAFSETAMMDFFHKPHSKEWNVFIAKPFSGESKVIKYLGRYMNKTAISNSRILNVNKSERTISFQYKNYRTKNLNDEMILDVAVFVRRFANCIMPKGFHNVRHGGAYGNVVKKENVVKARLKVYGEWRKPVEVLKEVYQLERKVASIIDSISICGKCFSEFEMGPVADSS